jgi:hypothetical protein
MAAKKKKQPTYIEDFPIATRTINLLKNEGILISDDFANYSKKNLQEIGGLGPTGLAELLLFLKGAKIKLKKAEPKEKKAPRWPKETKEILEEVQGVVNSYVREIPLMGKLIEEFGAETMRRVKIPYGKNSVQYFFTGGKIAGWSYEYIQRFAPIRLVERPVEPVAQPLVDLEGDGGVEEVVGPVEPYIVKPKVPKTLGEFLSLRK